MAEAANPANGIAGLLVAFADAELLARGVADWFARQLATAPGPCRVALSGGSTPKALFRVLAAEPYASQIPWRKLHFFWGDERFVPPDDPQSNFGAARALLLSQVAIPPANIHPVPTDVTPEDAARRYQAELAASYGATELAADRPLFDIVFLGLGEDGHTASLLPGQPVLQERRRWIAAVDEGRPERRVTLTYPAIESSRVIAFLVSGASKSAMLREVRSGQASVPAARIVPRGAVIWFVEGVDAG